MNRKKSAAFVSLALAGGTVLGLLFFVSRQWHPASTEVPSSELPILLPEQQEVISIEELERLTSGKPLPPSAVLDSSPPPFDADEHIRGDRNAKMSIIEYAAFGGKYTKLVHGIIESLQAANPATLNWVFRQYPSGNPSPSWDAAELSECVALLKGNDVFWSFLDAAVNQASVSAEQLDYAMQKVGVSPAEVRACKEEGKRYDHVLLDSQGASFYKVGVVPTFVLINHANGQVRVAGGINTQAYFQSIIDAMQ